MEAPVDAVLAMDLVPVLDRDRAIERLQAMYARDQISLDDLELRLTNVERATTKPELEAILSDLPTALAVRTASDSLAVADHGVDVHATFGAIERRGQWRVPPVLHVRALFGSVELDFTSATLPDVVDVHVSATFGSISIRVPSGVTLEVAGQALLGSFEDRSATTSGKKCIRIHGRALFGSVEVF